MEINDYFSNRRTIRCYDKSRELSRDTLLEMLGKAAHAANTGNMQIYSVIVTTDPEEIAKIAPCHFNQPASVNASALLTFCLDLNRFNRWCRLNNATPGLNNFQGFTWGVIDTSIFAQQFCTIAELNGLGTCYLGTTTYNAEQISEILNLPEDVIPIITVATGYPAGESEIQDRLPIESIVHFDTYHNPTDTEINQYYTEKEHLPESEQFVKENRKDNLAQVYADIRYPREANEKFSRIYKEFIKNKGVEL